MENELDLQESQEKPRPKRSIAKKPSGFDAPTKTEVVPPVKKVEAPRPPAPVVAEPEPIKVVTEPEPAPTPTPAPDPTPAPEPIVSRRKTRVARPRRKNDGESNRGLRVRY